MSELSTMQRVICGHQWHDIDEWVDCLHSLSAMSDDEITRLCELMPATLHAGHARAGARERATA